MIHIEGLVGSEIKKERKKKLTDEAVRNRVILDSGIGVFYVSQIQYGYIPDSNMLLYVPRYGVGHSQLQM